MFTHYFHALVGPGWIPQEARKDTLCQTCVFASSAISGARNVDALFFILRWARCGTHKMGAGIRYFALVFLQLERSEGHVVCSRREMLMHYFLYSGGPGVDPIKRAPKHVMLSLCFCIRCDMWLR
jgi:hypothetical protein